MAIKVIYNALVVYDGDFHIGTGSKAVYAIEECYAAMVENEIIEEHEWADNGYSSKSDYLRDWDSDLQVYEWTNFMTQAIFDSLEEWKGFYNDTSTN